MHPASTDRPSLGRRLAGNQAAQMLDLGVRVAQQVLLVPVLILGWGIDRYADWLLLIAFAGLATGIDFGIAWHFANRMHQAWASGDAATSRRELRIGLTLLGMLVPVLPALGLVVSVVGPGSGLDTKTLGLLLLSQALLHPRNLLASVYRAHGHYGVGIVLHNLITVAQALALAAAALCGIHPFWAASSQGLLALLGLVWLRQDIGRRFGPLPLCPLLPEAADLRAMAGTLPGFTSAALANVLWAHGPILLLRTFSVTAELIVTFTLLRTLVGLVRQVIVQLALGGGVEIADQRLRGGDAIPWDLVVKANRLLAGLGGMMAAGLVAFVSTLVSVWTHGQLEGDRLALAVMLAGVLLASPAQVPLAMLVFLNRPGGAAIATGIASVGGLALAALTYPIGGLLLFLAALALMEALGAQLAARRLEGLATGDLLRSGIAHALLGIACGTAVAWPLSLWSLGGGLLELVIHLGIFAIVMAASVPFILLDRRQRSWLLDLRRRIWSSG